MTTSVAPSTDPPPPPTTIRGPGSDTTTTEVAPEDVPFPAAALPILGEFVLSQPVWSLQGFDNELVFGHGMGIGRLDLDDGSVMTSPLAMGDEPKAEVFYSISDGSSYVAVVDVAGAGTVDVLTTVDPQTLERMGTLVSTPPDSILASRVSGEAPHTVITFGPDGRQVLDVATAQLDLLDPLADTTQTSASVGFAHSVDGELWVWNQRGQVRVLDEDGAVVATVETDHTYAPFSSTAVLVTPTSLWLADDTTSELVRIDRSSFDVTERLDLREHFAWADAVKLRTTGPTERFVLANTIVGDDGWWMLVEIEPETGEVRSEHVIATDSFEYGWNAFDAPEITTVGDRMFVRDHRRRIVEVDVAALGRRSSTAWVDSGVGRAPVLDDEEQVIAELTLELVNKAEAPPLTDPGPGNRALDMLAALRRPGATWEIYGVEVDGERASARTAPVGEIGAYFVFRRIDGEWRLDSDALCELGRNLGDPCELSTPG